VSFVLFLLVGCFFLSALPCCLERYNGPPFDLGISSTIIRRIDYTQKEIYIYIFLFLLFRLEDLQSRLSRCFARLPPPPALSCPPASSLFAIVSYFFLSRLATIFPSTRCNAIPAIPPALPFSWPLSLFLFFPLLWRRQSDFLNPISRIPLSPLFSIFFLSIFTVSKIVRSVVCERGKKKIQKGEVCLLGFVVFSFLFPLCTCGLVMVVVG